MWEMVRDNDKSKCWLNLNEISKRGQRYDWKNSVGRLIGSKYQWMNDEVEERWFEIIGYDKETYKLTLKWNDSVYEIQRNSLLRGSMGNIFGKKTSDFKFEIGETVNGLTIMDRYYKKGKKGQQCKWYKFRCEKGHMHEMVEGNLKNNHGCVICSNRVVLEGYNDIATTHPHLVQYFKNPDEAKKYTYNSNKRVTFKCPFCGKEKEMGIDTLTNRGFSCSNCSDGVPLTEKFMSNLLSFKKIEFIHQASKNYFDWLKDDCRYDFALPNNKTIIEIDGDLRSHGDRTNDDYKDQLALNNNWNIVRINLIEETYIGNFEQLWNAYKPILDELRIILTEEEAKECYIKSQTSIFHLVVQIANEYPEFNREEIADELKNKYGYQLDKNTIGNYLKRANKLGLTNYMNKDKKQVICINTEIVYPSSHEAERQTGVAQGSIIACCRGKLQSAGKDETGEKLVWKYYEED